MQRIILFSAMLLLAVSTLQAQTIRYVKPVASGTQDGYSWANASADLQLMINSSAYGDEIWVAAGTYKPNRPANNLGTIAATNRDNSFVLKSGVKVYGGFAGNEATFAARDWAANITTLSGDINNSGTVDNSDAHHVLISAGAVGTAVLDGFTVTGGNANGSSSITVNAQTVSRSIGGGMYNTTGSAPVITNCIISGNSANQGGGIYNNASSPNLANCVFSGNAGGMYNISSSPSLANCVFAGNSTTNGGGMYNTSFSSPSLANCVFSGNSAGSSGGGMLNNTSSSPSLANCVFSGNAATAGGGMFNATSASPILANCTFSGNSAGNNGGGIQNSGSSPTLANCIIWNNRAGGVTTSASASISNTASAPSISYSLIANSGGSAAWVSSIGTNGGNNIDANPLFVTVVDPTTAPTTASNLRLQSGSPAINAGNNAAMPSGITTDLDGNARIFNTTVDMGAFEYVATPVTWYLDVDGDGWYVSTQTSVTSPGTGWTDVLPSGGSGDCDDNNNLIHAEFSFYVDADGDSYGTGASQLVCAVDASTPPGGYADNNTDCNDANNNIHEPQQYYVDADGDGYGSTTTAMLCLTTAPTGYSTNDDDCDDNNSGIHTPPVCQNGGTVNINCGCNCPPGYTGALCEISPPGAALSFDGVNDYVLLGNTSVLRPTNSLTIELWIHQSNWSSLQTERTIAGNTESGGYVVWFDATGNLAGWVRRNGVYGKTSFNATTLAAGWHHVAVTYDGRFIRLYVDGANVSSDDAGGNYPIQYSVNNAFLIGAEVSSGSSPVAGTYYTGKIDELRIWNRALCQTEISNNRSCELNPSGQNGLLALYHFNQGISSTSNTGINTLTDAGVNNINGTLNNFALSGNSSNWVAPGGVTTGNSCTAFIITNPIVPTINTSSIHNCGVQSATLSIATGSLNTATDWKWYSGSCGGTLVGTGTSISVSPAVTTTYYVRGEGICTTPGTCASITIHISSPVFVNATATHVTCNGGSNGAIDLTVSGGTSPYSYDWGGGITTGDRTGLSAGTYSITVTDGNGCVADTSISITEPSPPACQNGGVPDTSCGCDCPSGYTGVFCEISTPGAALNFDGADDRVSIANSVVNNLSAGTIEAWVNPSSVTNQALFTKQHDGVNSYAMLLLGGNMSATGNAISGTAGKVYFHLKNEIPNLSSTTLLNTGNWYHIAVTWNGTSASMYINGVLESNLSGAYTLPGDVSPFTTCNIGAWITNEGNQFFHGDIDELRIWSRALCQDEIQNNMSCELNASGQTDLLALYHFNQGLSGVNNNAITSLTDASVNNLHGTLNGFALAGNTSNWVAPGGVTTGTSCSSFVATNPDVPTLNASSIINCGTQNTTLSIQSGNLNQATGWNWYSGSCGGTLVGTGTSINISPAGTTTYFARGEGGCVTAPGSCGSITITVTQPVSVSGSVTDVSCNGGSNGAIDISVSGGTAPYTYDWGGGIFTEDRMGLAAGNYTVTVTDTNGCADVESFTIIEPAPPACQNGGVPDTSCGCDCPPGYTGTLCETAIAGAALSFDGIDDYVSLGNSVLLHFSDGLTMEAWVHQDDWSVKQPDQSIAGNTQNGGFVIFFDNNGNLAGWVRRNGDYGKTSFNAGGLSSGWHHVAVTYNRRFILLYVDGVKVDSNDAGADYPIQYNSINNAFIIGAEASTGATPVAGTYFEGKVDELRIWDRPLCQAAIQNNMNCELSAAGQTGLRALYHFNQGLSGANNNSIISLTDASVNNLHGTLNNFALSGNTSNWIAPGGVTTGTSCSSFAATNPAVPILSASSVTNCGTQNTTLSIQSGNLNQAAGWKWYSGSCGGTLVGTGTSINVSPTATTTYYARGEGGCITAPGSCGSITINVTTPPVCQNGGTVNASCGCNCPPGYSGTLCETITAAAALNFDGTNDRVSVASSVVNNLASGTIETWIKPSSLTNQAIFTKQRDGSNSYAMLTMGLEVNSNGNPVSGTAGKIYFHLQNGLPSLSGTTILATNNWYHVAVTWNGSSAKMYINGSLEGTVSGSYSLSNDVNASISTNIGAWITSQGNIFFNGSMDEFRVWTRALCQGEIQHNMNCELSNSGQTGLRALYHFNQGMNGTGNSGITTLTDASGNSNNGTLNNFALSGSTSNWIAPGGVLTGNACSTFNPAISFSACPANQTTNTATGTCAATVSYTATATGGATLAYSFSGATTGSGSGSGSGSSFNKGLTNVSITATSPCGTNANCSFTVTVTDNELPVAVCKNITVPLNASGNAGITAVQINNGSSDACGIAGMTVSPGNFTCANAGANTVTLTVTDASGNSSACTSTVTVTDNIAPSITCPPTAFVNTDPNSCVATGVVLGIPVTNDNCGVLSVVNNHPSTTYRIGDTTVTWTVTDIHGNTSTCTQVVSVTNANVVAVNISTASTTICSGTVVPFTATPISGGTNPGYQWKVNGANKGTNSPDFTPATLANGNAITCVMTSNITCPVGPLTKTSNSLQMSLIGAPPKPGAITQTSGKLKLCPGDTASYSIAPVLNAINLTWTAPSGSTIISGQNTTSVTLAFNSGFAANGNLNVVAENNCGFSQIQSKAITRNTLPVVSAISGSSPVACIATGVSYDVNAVEDASFNWYFTTSNAVVASGNGSNSILADFSEFTSTTLYVSATTGCGTSALKSKAIKYIPENTGAISGPTSVCSLATHVAYSITPLPNVTSYTWTAPNGAAISDGVTTQSGTLITASANVTINFGTKSGAVKVKSNDCSSGAQSSLNVAIVSCTRSFAEINEQDNSSISLFPNPAKELINVMFRAAKETSYEIRVYDALGKEVLQQDGNAIGGSNQTALHVSGFATGVYLIRVNGEDMSYQARFTVQ